MALRDKGILVFLLLLSAGCGPLDARCRIRPFCPVGWEPRFDNCHTLYETASPMSWKEAGRNCRLIGGDLIGPSSEEENALIQELTNRHRLNATWIDCTVVNGVRSCNGAADGFSAWAEDLDFSGNGTYCGYGHHFRPFPLRVNFVWNVSPCGREALLRSAACRRQPLTASAVSAWPLRSWRLLLRACLEKQEIARSLLHFII